MDTERPWMLDPYSAVLRRSPFYCAVAVSVVILFTPPGPVPTGPPHTDKIVHVVLFAALAGTGIRAELRAPWLPLGLMGYALASEALQAWLPIDRDAGPADLAADLLGLLCGWALTKFIRSHVRVRNGSRRARVVARDSDDGHPD